MRTYQAYEFKSLFDPHKYLSPMFMVSCVDYDIVSINEAFQMWATGELSKSNNFAFRAILQ